MTDFKEKLEKYLEKAKPLFDDLEDNDPGEIDYDKKRKEFREMILGYYNDAQHFYEKKEYPNALAALEYAEGWMDAGKRLGLFK